MTRMGEQVLVIPRSHLTFLPFHGFQPEPGHLPESFLMHCRFEPRDLMEQDPSYKQLIPYVLLTCAGQVFRYCRTRKGGEERLHHLYSVGVGGHINPQDENGVSGHSDLLLEAALRELREEVNLQSPCELEFCGYINDDDSPVGQVHLGLVYRAELPDTRIRAHEDALQHGEWKPQHELLDGVDYETWSQFVLHEFLGIT